MTKLTFTERSGRRIYQIPDDTCREMFARADAELTRTYPEPNRGFAVTVLTESGTIYEGVSYSSKTETLTMHSEATALAHAAIHGEPNVVAITGPNCHICKQLIWEQSLRSSIDVVVIFEEGNQIKQVPISEQMPYPWPAVDGSTN